MLTVFAISRDLTYEQKSDNASLEHYENVIVVLLTELLYNSA